MISITPRSGPAPLTVNIQAIPENGYYYNIFIYNDESVAITSVDYELDTSYTYTVPKDDYLIYWEYIKISDNSRYGGTAIISVSEETSTTPIPTSTSTSTTPVPTTPTSTTQPPTTQPPKIPCCPPRVQYIFPPPVENTTKKPTELPPIPKISVPRSQSLTDPSTIIETTPPATTSTTTIQPTTTQMPINTTVCIYTHCKKLNF
jgi:hypothetical protein